MLFYDNYERDIIHIIILYTFNEIDTFNQGRSYVVFNVQAPIRGSVLLPSGAGGGVWEGASPFPRVKKVLKNTNEMNASEDVESKNKSSIDLVRI